MEESWAENEFRGEKEKQAEKKLIFCCRSNVQFTKNLLAIDLIMKTHLSLVAVLPHTQPTSQFFKNIFCDVQFLVCLDLTALCFLFFTKNTFFFGGGGDMQYFFFFRKKRTQMHFGQRQMCDVVVIARLKVARHVFL